MTLFCSTAEFESLCRDLRGKAGSLRLQAKGGSMYPFIRSGDWVQVALEGNDSRDIAAGDIILFSHDGNMYLHRVLRARHDGYLVKGDMSFGPDGIVGCADVLGRVVLIEHNARQIDLRSGKNRSIAALCARLSLVLQYPVAWCRPIPALFLSVLVRIQSVRMIRWLIKKILFTNVTIRAVGPHDLEQLRDLYCMAGHDVKQGLSEVSREGQWLVAESRTGIVAGLTMTRYEKDDSLWVIFGLEVKPLFRGRGIGGSLVREAVRRAACAGGARMGLFVNRNNYPAVSMYRKLGFTPTDTMPAEFNRSENELYLGYQIRDEWCGCEEFIISVLRSNGRPGSQQPRARGMAPGSQLPAHFWQACMERSIREGVFFPFYKELCRDDLQAGIPDDMRQLYTQAYYLHIAKSTSFMLQVSRVLACIESRKIPVVLIKGPAVDSLIYKDYMRPRLDLDIIVKDEDLRALESALLDLGYACDPVPKDYPIPEYVHSRLFISRADDNIPVHAHTRLINNMFLSVDSMAVMDEERVWNGTAPYRDYCHIRVLNPELNILFLCEHGLKHDLDQLVFLYEIEQLLRQYANTFDWDEFRVLAGSSGLNRPAYYVLYFLNKLFSYPVPERILPGLEPDHLSRGERVFITKTLEFQRSRYASYPVYLAMRKGLLKKIRFVFRTFFPPGFTLKGFAIRMSRLIRQ